MEGKDKIIFLIISVLLILGFFSLGVIVGREQARFFCNWLEKYPKNFMGYRMNFDNLRRIPKRGLIKSHGIFGEIVKINNDEIIIKDIDELEKVILIDTSTIFKLGRETITKNNLAFGDKIVVIGQPNNEGQIKAKFIRVFK